MKIKAIRSKRKDHELSLKESLKKPYPPTSLLGWSIVQTKPLDPSEGFEKWGFLKHAMAALTIFGGEGWEVKLEVEEGHGQRIRDALRLHTRDTESLYHADVEVTSTKGFADRVVVTFVKAEPAQVEIDNRNRRQRAKAAKRFLKNHPERVKMIQMKTKMRNKHMEN
jgi:hypothetical protein